METPELLMTYEISFFTNQQLCLRALKYIRSGGVMVKAVASQMIGLRFETALR